MGLLMIQHFQPFIDSLLTANLVLPARSLDRTEFTSVMPTYQASGTLGPVDSGLERGKPCLSRAARSRTLPAFPLVRKLQYPGWTEGQPNVLEAQELPAPLPFRSMRPAQMISALSAVSPFRRLIHRRRSRTSFLGVATVVSAVALSRCACAAPRVTSAPTVALCRNVARTTELTPLPPVVSLLLSPSTVTSGELVWGTLTFETTGPHSVTLASSQPDLAEVPTSVTVPPGEQSASFWVKTRPVAQPVTVQITAPALGGTRSATLRLMPVGVSGISNGSVGFVPGGERLTGWIGLSGAAPPGGGLVALTSDGPGEVPPVVVIPPGATGAEFPIITYVVRESQKLLIQAPYGGSYGSGDLGSGSPRGVTAVWVWASGLDSLQIYPTRVRPGDVSDGIVVLWGSALDRYGSRIKLSSSRPDLVSVPAEVHIPYDRISVTFPVSVRPAAAAEGGSSVQIRGEYAGVTKTVSLTILGPEIVDLTLDRAAVVGGLPATGGVTISDVAPSGGLPVTVSSTDVAIPLPANVTVPAGRDAATFSVKTSPVSIDTVVTLSAAAGGATRTAALKVLAPVLADLSLQPGQIIAGNTATGTVTLNGPAPEGGMLVSLSSGDSAIATVPETVSVAAGSTTATFRLTAGAVDAPASVVITAATVRATQTATVQVLPEPLTAFTLLPTPVVGGRSATGVIVLSTVVPARGMTIAVASANRAVASVPAQVKVAAGKTMVTFPIKTNRMKSAAGVMITATAEGSFRTAILSVLPAGLKSLKLQPKAVRRGSLATVWVTLGMPAPVGGLSITVASNRPGVAGVPTSVVVPEGSTTVSFPVTTYATASPDTVVITASLGGAAQTVRLSVRR
jgi:hypothetical protein